MTTSRRQFLQAGGAAVAGAALLPRGIPLSASPMNQPLGFQAFEIIEYLVKDWQGTWNKMSGFGYKFVDLVQFSPRYAAPLAKRSAKEIRQSLQAAGLGCDNCHFGYGSWMESFGQTVAFAHDLELKSVVCGPPPRRKTADDWKWMGDLLNQLGARLQREGLQLGYHNHEVEFRAVEGQVPWDILMSTTDPTQVKFQVDVGNLTFGGGDAVEYLAKYPDRYFSLHAKDFAPGKAAVPVGSGILDWNQIFALAAKANITSYVAEVGAYGAATMSGEPLEPSPMDVLELFRLSFVFLNDFKNS